MQSITPPPDDHSAPRPEMTRFEWRTCPLHPAIRPSVIVVSDATPWCIGLPDEIPGHPVEAAAA